MRRRIGQAAGLLLTAGLLMAVLSGCGQAGRTGRSEPGPDQSRAPEHEPITIVTAGQNYAGFSELLEKTYPEIRLELISYAGRNQTRYLQRSLEEGVIPDIYTSTAFPDGDLQRKCLLDLSGYSLVNGYASTMLDAVDVEGNLYLLPSGYTLTGIVYNKTVLEENGWPVPHSFRELKALIPKIKAAGYEPVNMNTRLPGVILGTFFGLSNTNFFYTPEGGQWKKDFLAGRATAAGRLEPAAEYMQKWIDAGLFSNYYYNHPDQSCSKDFKARKFVFRVNMSPVAGEEGGDQFGFLPYLSEDGSHNMLVRQISRYYGLNRELGEPGNEQKLADAVKVLELMNTLEGQAALSGGNEMAVAPLKLISIPEDSVYGEVADLISGGYMVDVVNEGWEEYIIPLVERYGRDWLDGRITGDDFLAGMDIINQEVQAGAGTDVIAEAPQGLSLEDTARMVAIAEGRAADADAALVSLGGFHGFSDGNSNENSAGINAGIFPGSICPGDVSMVADTTSGVLVLELTGSELKALAEGGLDCNGNGAAYPYVLVLREGAAVQDSRTYRVAIGSNNLIDEDLLGRAEEIQLSTVQAVTDYLSEMSVVTAGTLHW